MTATSYLLVFCLAKVAADVNDPYVGCFVDGLFRNLPDMTIDPENTVESCISTCKESNYAGVEFGKECFCGNSPLHYPLRPDSECDMSCPGNVSQKCGGRWRIAIYKTDVTKLKKPKTDHYLGCFQDKAQRLLPFIHFDRNNAAERCIERCKEISKRIAGLEYGKECFCGDEMKDYLQRPESECDMICPGDNQQTCGGSWRINVYKTEPKKEDCLPPIDPKGISYDGDISVAWDGAECFPWEEFYSSYISIFQNEAWAKANGNKCRNPDNSIHGPWCYNNDGTQSVCNIPVCQ